MGASKHSSQGFTLIASLLILVLLSGVAAGLLYLVANEAKMGGSDLESNLAYYGAESGMEKLTSDLAALYEASQSPSETQVQALASFTQISAVPNMTYQAQITFPTAGNSVAGMPCTTTQPGNAPPSCPHTVTSGGDAGLYAELTPMTLQVIATRPSGASVWLTRTVEVAAIPVFQFGVFCAYDCSYHAGPNFSFGGRVHANGNLFVTEGDGSDLVFNDKISAYKQVVMDRLADNWLASNGYSGTVYVSTAAGGCPLNTFPPPTGAGTNCVQMPAGNPGDASWSGGIPTGAGSANANFPSISTGTLNGYVTNSLTGATKLELPFVNNSCDTNPPPCTDPISIIRKPQPGETATSTLGTSRLYNKASIRILMADSENDLHPERPGLMGDVNDIQMNPNFTPPGGATEAFARANTAIAGTNWIPPYIDAGLTTWTQWPLLGEVTQAGLTTGTNPANSGAWLRVEYLNNAGQWVGVTQEWLKLGFGKPLNANFINPAGNGKDPNAILILQQLRNGTVNGTNSTDWYPINFYDTREGEMRDNQQNTNSCAVNGIMNVVELDVGNLARWLKGTIAGSGTLVNYTNQNGYVLYFSNHRGALLDPNPTNGGQTPAGVISGESGLEDVINRSQPANSSTPDGVLEPITYYTYSPEDVDQNGVLDAWGAKNIGYGFGLNTNTALPLNSYVRNTQCSTQGLANMVTGARHALRLVDGGMNAGVSYLPVRPDNSQGGFTVASENPVYVYGNYNSNNSDPFWGTANNATPTQPTQHAAASIIADAVTLLSNQWSDANSLTNTTCTGGSCTIQRQPTQDAYYRTAVASGKNIPFPYPTWATSADFGSDGGLHNFLRYLENWTGWTLHYNGSLISMYYAEYNTGTFKCCTAVYDPPQRDYYFDVLFLNPADLPPATPMFQDVVNLSYHQNFQPGNSVP